MYDTQITLTGWIGGEVTLREVAEGRHVASFRVACTPTRYRDGEWIKGTTSWHTVKVWNRLARHVAASLHSGDPVVVHGRLVADVWEREGKPQTSWEVVATSVGHDLAHGTTTFTKPASEVRRRGPDGPTEEASSPGRVTCPRTCGDPVAGQPDRHTSADRERGAIVGGARVPRRLARMAEYVFTLRNVRKAHGDKVVLDNVTLSFLHGAKIGVVGPNGTGKSSLLKIMAQLDHANNGDAILDPDATVGMLQQEPPLSEGKTVLENVEEAVGELKGKMKRLEEAYMEMGEPDADQDALMEETGNLQTELDNANAWDLDSRLDQAMDALRCPPPDVLVDNLSGGERRRVALCKLLLQQPDLLLLDEPTNHLDAESVQWLEGHLASYPGAVLAVTHDRYFLDNVAQWILELDRGKAHPYEGNYTTYLETKQSRLKIEGQKDAKRAKVLERELEWVRSNAKARQTKSKSRLARYEEMAAEADRMRKIDTSEINIPAGPRLGDIVLEADEPRQGLRGPHPHARRLVQAAARRHRRRHRPQRRRQDHALPDDHGGGEARRGRAQGRPDGQALLRRPEPRRHRPQQERLGGRLRRPRLHQGRQLRDEQPRLRRLVRLQGPRPAEEGRRALRW